MTDVAALFVRADSVYKLMPGIDCYDATRDARTWRGGVPIIAHPPCAQWGGLSHMARHNPEQKELAVLAVNLVRKFGGVLEHPRRSKLWLTMRLPMPGAGADEFGGWTLAVSQKWFGHRAEKLTFLYIVGRTPNNLPAYPITLGEATHICGSSGRRRDGSRMRKPEITHPEREATPFLFAQWLYALAQGCKL
jgi:hypothetical protein